MRTEIYIANIKDDVFDFNDRKTYKNGFPEMLCKAKHIQPLYNDIMKADQNRNKNVTQIDFCSWVFKSEKNKLIEILDKPKYKETSSNKKAIEYLIQELNKLPDGDYLLVALFGN